MKVSLDADALLSGLDALADDAYSVARTMGAAVGAAMRDEAKASIRSRSGLLASSLYVAFNPETSTNTSVMYSVSWNRKKAPHGHLVEFGHWRTNVTVQLPDGRWITTKEKLPKPEWVPARPFLRPAQSAVAPRALNIAVAAGSRRFAELTNGGTNGNS